MAVWEVALRLPRVCVHHSSMFIGSDARADCAAHRIKQLPFLDALSPDPSRNSPILRPSSYRVKDHDSTAAVISHCTAVSSKLLTASPPHQKCSTGSSSAAPLTCIAPTRADALSSVVKGNTSNRLAVGSPRRSSLGDLPGRIFRLHIDVLKKNHRLPHDQQSVGAVSGQPIARLGRRR